MEVREVEQLLRCALVPDSNVVRDATAKLKVVTKSANGCGALLSVLTGSESKEMRQLAVTLLRRHLPKLWKDGLGEQQQRSVKEGLLQMVLMEKDPVLKESIAMLQSAIFPLGPWPELLPFIETHLLVPTQESSVRGVGFTLLRLLLEVTSAEEFPVSPGCIDQTFKTMTADADVGLRITALRTLGALAIHFGEDTRLLQMIPEALKAAREVTVIAASGSSNIPREDVDVMICTVFDVLEDIVELWNPMVREMFPMMLSYGLEESLRSDGSGGEVSPARQSATEFVATCVNTRPKAVKKNKLIETCVDAAYQLICESEQDAVDVFSEEVDADEPTALILGIRMLDAIATRLPPKQVYARCMGIAEQLAASPQPYRRAVGYRSIAIIAEGCCLEFTSKVRQVLSALSTASGDSDAVVRESAIRALGAVAECVEIDSIDEDVRKQARQIAIDAAVRGIQDSELRVRRIGCSALEASLTLFFEEVEIAPHINVITNALSSAGVLEEAVSAAAAIAEVSLQSFSKSEAFPGVLQAILGLLDLEDEQGIRARAVATRAAGSILACMTDDDPRRDEAVNYIAAKAIAGYAIDNPELREHTHMLFSRLAETLGPKGLPMFALPVMEHAIESLRRDDIVLLDADGQEIDVTNEAEVEKVVGGDDDDDLNLEDDEDDIGLNVRTGYLDEKLAAVEAIGAIAMATVADADFRPPNPDQYERAFLAALDAVDQFEGYFHEGIRAAVVRLSARIAVSTKASFYSKPEETRERAVKATFTMAVDLLRNDDANEVRHREAQELLLARASGGGGKGKDLASVSIVHRLKEQCASSTWIFTALVNQKAVAGALDSVSIVCDGLGPAPVEPFRADIVNAIKEVLNGSAACRLDIEDEVEGGGFYKDDDERRDELLDAIADAVLSLCKAFRAYFTSEFLSLLPLLVEQFCTEANPAADVSRILGPVAECLDYLHFDDSILPLPAVPDQQQASLHTLAADSSAKLLLPVAAGSIADVEQSGLRRNAVFLLGVLFHRSSAGSEIWSEVSNVVQKVATTMMDRGTERDGAVVDNAAGCLGRILAAPALPAGALSLADILAAMLTAVPVEDDLVEIFAVGRGILATSSKGADGQNAINAHASRCAEVLARSLLLYADKTRKVDNPITELTQVEASRQRELLMEMIGRLGNAVLETAHLDEAETQALTAILST